MPSKEKMIRKTHHRHQWRQNAGTRTGRREIFVLVGDSTPPLLMQRVTGTNSRANLVTLVVYWPTRRNSVGQSEHIDANTTKRVGSELRQHTTQSNGIFWACGDGRRHKHPKPPSFFHKECTFLIKKVKLLFSISIAHHYILLVRHDRF